MKEWKGAEDRKIAPTLTQKFDSEISFKPMKQSTNTGS